MLARSWSFVVVLSLAACRGTPTEPAATEASKPKKEGSSDLVLAPQALEAAHLKVQKVVVETRATTVVALGTIDFAQRRVARVGPLLEGRIVALAVKPGDHLPAGAVLASLESLDVGRSRADYVASLARREQASLEFERETKLREQELNTERRLVEARTEQRLADLGVRAAEERLRAVGVDAKVTAKGPSSIVNLTTPVAGEVMEVRARIGQAVSATDTLFVVGSIDELWLDVHVYERDLGRVHAGDAARITTVAQPDKVYEGRVEHVHGMLDPDTRVADVRVVLANPNRELLPGMSATVRIACTDRGGDAGPASPVPIVPRSAIQFVDGQPYVFIEKNPGTYEMRAIERGADLGGLFEVTRGLSGGEPVVVDGGFLLKSELLREQMGKND